MSDLIDLKTSKNFVSHTAPFKIISLKLLQLKQTLYETLPMAAISQNQLKYIILQQ